MYKYTVFTSLHKIHTIWIVKIGGASLTLFLGATFHLWFRSPFLLSLSLSLSVAYSMSFWLSFSLSFPSPISFFFFSVSFTILLLLCSLPKFQSDSLLAYPQSEKIKIKKYPPFNAIQFLAYVPSFPLLRLPIFFLFFGCCCCFSPQVPNPFFFSNSLAFFFSFFLFCFPFLQ